MFLTAKYAFKSAVCCVAC